MSAINLLIFNRSFHFHNCISFKINIISTQYLSCKMYLAYSSQCQNKECLVLFMVLFIYLYPSQTNIFPFSSTCTPSPIPVIAKYVRRASADVRQRDHTLPFCPAEFNTHKIPDKENKNDQ